MKKLLLIACGVIAGCATGTAMQAECESQYTKFPDIYQCTRESVATRSPYILEDGRAKLYLLRGEQLAQEVIDGRMSSLDAKVLWQKLWVELKGAKDRESLERMDSVSRYLAASRKANPVNCTSRQSGNTVDTTCR